MNILFCRENVLKAISREIASSEISQSYHLMESAWFYAGLVTVRCGGTDIAMTEAHVIIRIVFSGKQHT